MTRREMHRQYVIEFRADEEFVCILRVDHNFSCCGVHIEPLRGAAHIKCKFVVIPSEETDWERRPIEREEHFVAFAVSERMPVSGIEMKSRLAGDSERDIIIKEL